MSQQRGLFGDDEPAPKPEPPAPKPSKVAQVCAEIKQHEASRPDADAARAQTIDERILRYERYNDRLARERNALLVAAARAIALIRGGQEQTAAAVLEEAKEGVEKGETGVPSPQ